MTLGILGACALTLALTDPRAAVLVATAGGLFGVLVTLVPGGGRAGATVGIREVRAVVVAGTLAIAATAWIGRDLSQLAAQPVVFGLAYLAFAVAVAMRFGAIPFHVWAARLADAVPEAALPILTALAPAAFAIVALAWIDASDRATARRPRRGPRRGPRHRGRLDRAGRCRRLRPGRSRAHRRVFDRRRRRGHPAGPGRARPGGVGAGPDLDRRVRGDPERLRGVGSRGPCRVLDGPRRRPARLGRALAAPRRRTRPGRDRRCRLPGTARVRRPGGARSTCRSTPRGRR